MKAPTIMVVEDDDLQYEIYEEALSKYRLMRVHNGSQALALIPKDPPDILILDHVLSDGELGLKIVTDGNACRHR